MITVIKHGTRHHRAMCNNCGCVYAYDETDVGTFLVEDREVKKTRCPECGTPKTIEEGDSNAGD